MAILLCQWSGDDGHHVDVFAVENGAVVFVPGDFAVHSPLLLGLDHLLGRAAQVVRVDIAGRDHIAERHDVGANSPAPAIAHPDAADHGAVVRQCTKGGRGGGHPGEHTPREGRERRLHQELTPGGTGGTRGGLAGLRHDEASRR